MEPADGATEIEVKTAGVTVNEAEPLTAPEVAVIVDAPGVRLVASPPLPTLAIDVADEAQLTLLVRFWVVPSL
jgi:hypothetical protein